MLTAHNLTKSYDQNLILDKVTLNLVANEPVALIGPNGCGKSTLMRLLAGVETPDQGHVSLSLASLRLAFVAQGFDQPPGRMMHQVISDPEGTHSDLEIELAELASRLALFPSDLNLQDRYDRVLVQLEQSRFDQIHRLHRYLAAFELDTIPPQFVLDHLSGGQKTRLALALALSKNPDILLLDEPTNHLDTAMITWLENWLGDYCTGPGKACLFVSHDREFIDQLAQRVLYLDPESRQVKSYPGNYSDYLDSARKEYNQKSSAYQDQQDEIWRIEQDIQRTRQQAYRVEQTTTSRQPGVRRIAKKVARKAASREKKLDRYVQSPHRVTKPKAGWQLDIDFSPAVHIGRNALVTHDLSVGYTPENPLLQELNLSVKSGQRIAFTGPNGSGKTTLMHTLTGKLSPLGGNFTVGSGVKLGFMSQEQTRLPRTATALEMIQAAAPQNDTEARNFLHHFLFSGDEPLRPVANLSFGERARLILACMVASGSTFLLLDEPINHLDIPSRTLFETALQSFPGAILAVVHDRYFIRRYATDVWMIEYNSIRIASP